MRNYKKVTSGGAVGIPVDMRRELGLQKGDPLEVELVNGQIIVTPFVPRCVFCDSQSNVVKYKGKFICAACAKSVGGNKNSKKSNGGK